MENQYDIKKIRDYINRCVWTWAKSYKALPHEWITRNDDKGRNTLTDEEYMDFVCTCIDSGIPQKFGKMEFHYLYIDGWKYWCCSNTPEDNGVINRAKIFYEFREVGYPYQPYYSEDALVKVNSAVMTHFADRDIFEIGVGNGDFLGRIMPDPKHYHGVEPNRNAISALKESFPDYKRCLTVRSFEEAVDRWSNLPYNVIGLFGSPSYVMPPYIKMLKDIPHFLMFYKEGYCPEEFAKLHHYVYTEDELRKMLPKSFICKSRDYYIVTSKPIDWSLEYKARPPRPVQASLF